MIEVPTLVLAAGEGMRLRPLTRHRPKPMVPVIGKPILEHAFDELIEAGSGKLNIVVGYRRERVQSHFGSTYRDVPLHYVLQKKQLGTGHAVLVAEDTVDDPFLVVNGDQIVDRGILREVLGSHQSTDAVVTLAVMRRPPNEEYGGVAVENGVVTGFIDPPLSEERDVLLNVGTYCFESDIFDAIRQTTPRDGEHSLVDAISHLVETGEEVRAVETEGLWLDATYPWDVLDIAENLFDHERRPDRRSNSVAESATVHEDATLREPTVVQPDCEIGPCAVVGPYVCLGENATVGSGAVLERCVVDADVRIGSNATLVDCVLGRGVGVGPGSTVPGGPGDVRVGAVVHEDERLGALLADRVRDRGGVTYVPGTIVGSDTTLHAGAVVRGTIEHETEVYS